MQRGTFGKEKERLVVTFITVFYENTEKSNVVSVQNSILWNTNAEHMSFYFFFLH